MPLAAGSDPVFNKLSSLYNNGLDPADYYNTSEVCGVYTCGGN